MARTTKALLLTIVTSCLCLSTPITQAKTLVNNNVTSSITQTNTKVLSTAPAKSVGNLYLANKQSTRLQKTLLHLNSRQTGNVLMAKDPRPVINEYASERSMQINSASPKTNTLDYL